MSTLVVPQAALDWRILSNVTIGGTGNGTNDYKDFWFKLKSILSNTGGFSGQWKNMHGAVASDPTACVVSYSSNGSTFGAGDKIDNSSGIVWGASSSGLANHTYFVLTFPGMGPNAELLFDFFGYVSGPLYTILNNPQELGTQPDRANTGGIYFSQNGGFTANGGALNRRPYAANEVQLFNRRLFNGGGSTNVVYFGGLSNSTTWTGKLHVLRTSDGSCTRAFFFYNGVPIWCFLLEKPGSPFHTNTDPDVVWNAGGVPWFGASYGSATVVSALLYNGTPNWTGSTLNLVTRLASSVNPTSNTVASIYPVLPYSPSVSDYIFALNHSVSSADGGYYPAPAGLACSAAGYVQPWLGTWQDMYFIGNNLTDATSGAEDVDPAGYSWRKVGNFLLPWDRSTMQSV